jgi:hypothetical protein
MEATVSAIYEFIWCIGHCGNAVSHSFKTSMRLEVSVSRWLEMLVDFQWTVLHYIAKYKNATYKVQLEGAEKLWARVLYIKTRNNFHINICLEIFSLCVIAGRIHLNKCTKYPLLDLMHASTHLTKNRRILSKTLRCG